MPTPHSWAEQRYKNILYWFKKKLKYGYIRDRNDDITEYTIVGFKAVEETINKLLRYIKLKRKQALIVLDVISKTPQRKRKFYTPELLLKLAKEVDKFADLNYSKKRKNTSKEVKAFLKSKNLFPRRD